jgi:hypothetical protein
VVDWENRLSTYVERTESCLRARVMAGINIKVAALAGLGEDSAARGGGKRGRSRGGDVASTQCTFLRNYWIDAVIGR